jgi:glycosyltransferase involved in cell wall biosynthesis
LQQFPAAEGIDLAELGVPKNRRAIVVVGRLHSQKGLDWLLRVAPQVLSQVPDADLVILGKGPEERALRALADQLHISERVHFAGWRSDVPAILKSSSVLVLPSRWEGMPNVILEAMATSLPVVATQAEGVAEVLGPLAEQQAIPFGDDQALVAKISSFLQEPPRALRLGGLNRERVEKEFSLEQMVSRYDQLYRELLEVGEGPTVSST